MSTYESAKNERSFGLVRVPLEWQPGPNSYAVRADGDCLEPIYQDGDTFVCDPDQEPLPGDFVAIWWRDGRQPSIKRLAMALPPRELMGLRGQAEFLLVCETLNPPRTLTAPTSEVEAVHKVIGRVEAA